MKIPFFHPYPSLIRFYLVSGRRSSFIWSSVDNCWKSALQVETTVFPSHHPSTHTAQTHQRGTCGIRPEPLRDGPVTIELALGGRAGHIDEAATVVPAGGGAGWLLQLLGREEGTDGLLVLHQAVHHLLVAVLVFCKGNNGGFYLLSWFSAKGIMVGFTCCPGFLQRE